MHPSWFDRVEFYLNAVEEIAAQIETTLKSARLDTSELNAEAVDQANAAMLESLAVLEQRIVQREQLLQAEDAPIPGVTLTEKIEGSGHARRRELAERCRSVSLSISSINQRAVSLFVCQFHLSQMSGEIIRLLAGQIAPPTYQAPNRSDKKSELGGGLFNEAA